MIRSAPNVRWRCSVRVRICRTDCADPDAAYSSGGHSYPTSGTTREVETAAPDVWTTIIDTHDHRSAIAGIRHSHVRTDWKRLRGGRQFIGIEDLAVTRNVAHESRAITRMRLQACPAEEQMNSSEMAPVECIDFLRRAAQSIRTSRWLLQCNLPAVARPWAR
jgi:hypothetical protein